MRFPHSAWMISKNLPGPVRSGGISSVSGAGASKSLRKNTSSSSPDPRRRADRRYQNQSTMPERRMQEAGRETGRPAAVKWPRYCT